MTTPGRPTRRRRPCLDTGFTLVELLVVMGIIALLLGVAAPAVSSLQRSNNLAASGQSIVDQITEARQIAASHNATVEVRFITPTTWAAQGATPYKGYHVVQLWVSNEAGTASVPLGRALALPDGIEVSGDSTLSPLLAQYSKAGTMASGNPTGSYVSFFIRPNGNVVLTGTNKPAANSNGSPIQSYFLTVVPVLNDASSTLPKNYITVQINPDTGRLENYQP